MPSVKSFSIIVPTIGESPEIVETLNALVHQVGLHSDTEIIVVDNRTDPESRNFDLEQLCRDVNTEIRYIHEPGIGLTRARHTGIAHARGDVIALIDDDVIIGDGWVEAVWSIFANDEIILAGGPSSPLFGANPPKWIDSFYTAIGTEGKMCTWLSLLDLRVEEELIDPNLIWGLNFVIRKASVYEYGGFHPDLVPSEYQAWQGDGETGLTGKLADDGVYAWYSESLRVFHKVPASRMKFNYMSKRAFFVGIGSSFTQSRKSKKEENLGTEPSRSPVYILRRIFHLARFLVVRPVGTIYLIRLRFRTIAGFKFHRKALKENPEIRSWVERKNFLDADIPVD